MAWSHKFTKHVKYYGLLGVAALWRSPRIVGKICKNMLIAILDHHTPCVGWGWFELMLIPFNVF